MFYKPNFKKLLECSTGISRAIIIFIVFGSFITANKHMNVFVQIKAYKCTDKAYKCLCTDKKDIFMSFLVSLD